MDNTQAEETLKESVAQAQSQEQETQEENQAPNEYEVKFAEIQKQNEELQERYKDLSRRLTREQQEKAELYRFHKSTLPQINKSFTERWEENPEAAVEEFVERKTKPVAERQIAADARAAETDFLVRNPEMAKYRNKVLDLGDTHPSLTTNYQGIEALYRMAEAESLKSEYEKLKSNGKAEAEKERAFTEGSSSKSPPTKEKRKLTAQERMVAQNLGIGEDVYIQQLERMGR